MVRKKEYPIEDISLNSRGYIRKNRKVVNAKTYGMLTLPNRFIGQAFDVYLIPVENNEERQE